MKWLLDKEIVSALSKPTRSLQLVAWLNKHADKSAISVITVGELSFGVRTAGNETASETLMCGWASCAGSFRTPF